MSALLAHERSPSKRQCCQGIVVGHRRDVSAVHWRLSSGVRRLVWMWSGLWHRLYDTKPVNSGGSITLCGGTVRCHEAVRRWRNEEVPIISEGLSGLANYTHCFWITGRSRFVTYQSAVAMCHGATSYTGKQCPIIIISPSLCSRGWAKASASCFISAYFALSARRCSSSTRLFRLTTVSSMFF